MASIKQESDEPNYEPPSTPDVPHAPHAPSADGAVAGPAAAAAVPETAVLDNYLAAKDFEGRICLVKAEGVTGKLWPALRFANWRELQNAIGNDAKDAHLRNIIVQKGMKAELGKGGIAYLMGRGNIKRSLVLLTDEVEVEDFYDFVSDGLQEKADYKDDPDFQGAFASANYRLSNFVREEELSPVKQEGAKSLETPAAANTNGTKDEEANSNDASVAAAADDEEDDGTVTVPLQINAATLEENKESEETPAANPAELTNGREADASPPATAEAQPREAAAREAAKAQARGQTIAALTIQRFRHSYLGRLEDARQAQSREFAAAVSEARSVEHGSDVEFGGGGRMDIDGGEEEETAKGGGGGIPNDALLTNRQAESQPNVVGAPATATGEASNHAAANDGEDYDDDDGVATLPLEKNALDLPSSVHTSGQRVDSPLTTTSDLHALERKRKRKGEHEGSVGKTKHPKKAKAKSHKVSMSPKKVATDEDISEMTSPPINEPVRVMTDTEAWKLLQSKFGVTLIDGRYCIPSQDRPVEVATSFPGLRKDLCINGLPPSTSELTEEQRVDIARWVRYANIPGLVDGQTITLGQSINKFMDAWGILTHKFGCQYSSGIYTVPMSRSGGDKKRFEKTHEVERHFARYGIPCIPADVSEDVLSQKDRLSLEIFFATPPFKALNTFDRESQGGSRRRKRVNYRED